MYFIYSAALGLVLLAAGLLWPNVRRRSTLSKIRQERPYNPAVKSSKLMEFLDAMTDTPMVRPYMPKPDSDNYVNLTEKIQKAGGMGGLNPNIVQLLRMVLPIVVFVVVTSVYLLSNLNQTTDINALATPQGGAGAIISLAQTKVVQVQAQTGPSPRAFLFIFMLSAATYLLPEQLINLKLSSRKQKIKHELPIMETFVVVMLESGTHTVYEILQTLLDTTEFFRPYIQLCLNEYNLDPKRAIQNMADRVGDTAFQEVCNGLKQAVEVDKKNTAQMMKQNLDKLRKLQLLERQAQIQKKPLLYAFLLALPMFGIIVIWLYPWFTRALKMFGKGGF